ncbi:uncharacterized protein LOC130993909 [Salvia miltiorrhiza]|uniref:uncharacterized protein LOC130993909 n=1 Tax=Salvia miltiorrhiza TaxID=226208 RepID=UPI0025AD680A|nr:uncharacterized protein LOC130993909 [Salvia miltiorrhiza]
MRRKDLTTGERNSVVQFLLEDSHGGKPKRGRMQAAAVKFAVCRRTVNRLWTAAKKQQTQGQYIHSSSGKINKSRRKRVEIDLQLISTLELSKRSTIRRLASGISCSKSTVGRWISKGLIMAHTSAIKPDLTAPNKLLRLRFSLEAIEYDRILKVLQFKSMHNTVHIDEKWFYITKSNHRPLIVEDGTVLFDGKIGIFPFTEYVPAKRSSKNREAGTLEQKPIQSITKEIIPAIKAKWPQFASRVIFIQQDNAKPHIKDSDLDFRQAASSDGFDIKIVHQPPNSPNTNINDLGWFRAIQSLQTESVCTNVDTLVEAVKKSFDELSPTTLNKVFLSLQGCLTEILKVKGQNCYKIPHMGKGSLIRQGQLPNNLQVPHDLVNEAINYLMENGIVSGMDHLRNALGISSISLDEVEYQMGHLGIQVP